MSQTTEEVWKGLHNNAANHGRAPALKPIQCVINREQYLEINLFDRQEASVKV